MRCRLSELRRLIRAALQESGFSSGVAGPSPSGAVDPTQKDEQPSLGLDDAAEKLHVGFYPYEIERGVPAPPPIIKSNKLGP